jgi:hypothetical protein
MHAVCRENGGVRNPLPPIMHPSIAIVYRHRVVQDEIVMTPEEWRLQIRNAEEPALSRDHRTSLM